ncbi:hypothetical protein FISHEDRAFT_56718 [Fistulina hepatica ATCC 64428]|uniref:FYVE-type domain-containing protein n=1 Tax=Fistulina hepatica ATCC 64428 TaxID=1128425 RepID=A0A0D7AHT8_9AGAR|nr:hypothetical protein FISHEDRAFT_56718 [Fistulina hepatica ATCC 64428]
MSALSRMLAALENSPVDACHVVEQQQQQHQIPLRPTDLVPIDTTQTTAYAESSASASSEPESSLEHLAVLLPRNLWNADASQCDFFTCRRPFTWFDRRHHCRKCGGAFCAAHSSHTTPLLDTSNLAFVFPPAHMPLEAYESPQAPIRNERVCDYCWKQIRGTSSGRCGPSAPSSATATESNSSIPGTPELMPDEEFPTLPRVNEDGAVSGPPSPLRTPSPRDVYCLRSQPSLASLKSSVSSQSSSSSAAAAAIARRRYPSIVREPEPETRSYGELDAYPLRHPSGVCKVAGGGRWKPRPVTVLSGYRVPVPGGKAPYELEMEREEREARLRQRKPLVQDGCFQYRFELQEPPCPLSYTHDWRHAELI